MISLSFPVGAGFVAEHLCAGVFIGNRDFEQVQQTDLDSTTQSFFTSVIDYKKRTVTTTAKGPFTYTHTAAFRDCLGCTILADITEAEFRSSSPAATCTDIDPDNKQNQPWPVGDSLGGEIPAGINSEKLSQALDNAFSEPDPEKQRSTRAVVVVYDGQLIAERYAPDISQDTPLHAWSMTKSITSARIGILVKQGKLSVDQPATVPEWHAADDSRSVITLNHLL